ncbi:hypothetical protein FHX37_4110 [Haloactinospora alba]|uniref:Uncharacterized protein n=1 Tax=Haloactinospora alba TaxID=405555 RepID=A0A543NAC5_9ACTN|nr:hypothetical protein FHX37_4110 [Haloactinospora alba]
MEEGLAEAARRRAQEQGVSLAKYLIDLVRHDLRQAEEEAFWQPFADYYSDPEKVSEAQAEAERYAATLADGIDVDGRPDEAQ